jgi:hypothetical protein
MLLLADNQSFYGYETINDVHCFKRTYKNGGEEVFGSNSTKGISIEKPRLQQWSKTTLFTSGRVQGKIRRFEQSPDGKSWNLSRNFSYDENGELLRAAFIDKNHLVKVNQSERMVSLYKMTSNELLWSKCFDQDGKIITLTTPFSSYIFSYDGSPDKVTIHLNRKNGFFEIAHVNSVEINNLVGQYYQFQ